MKRRNFLKYASVLAASAALPTMPRTQLVAAEANYTGPLWITIHAGGGWDPTSFCDPKGYNGSQDAANPDRINNYDKNNILTIGNFNVAPPPDSFLPGNSNFDENLYSAQQFFETYFEKLMVINGIDVKTNSHSNGNLNTWSGTLRSGFPSFPALTAGTLAPDLPLSYLINGGYSFPAELVVPTRMDSRGIATLYEIAFPNRSTAANRDTSPTYFNESVRSLIETASQERLNRLSASNTLARVKNAIQSLSNARQETRGLEAFTATLDARESKTAADFNNRNNAFNFYKQGRLALAAYEAGVTSAANIVMGGFDTHGDHDARHYPRLMDLLMGIDGILQEAELRGLSDRIVIVVGSEFGRTNKYNSNNGKDHWPITSMMLIGNTTQVIPGNQVIGATNDLHKAVNIDPVTLQADFNDSNPNAVRLTPAHVHRSLRRLAGIDQLDATLRFGLEGQDLPLFGV